MFASGLIGYQGDLAPRHAVEMGASIELPIENKWIILRLGTSLSPNSAACQRAMSPGSDAELCNLTELNEARSPGSTACGGK